MRSAKVMLQQVKEQGEMVAHLTGGCVYLVKGSKTGEACR